MQYIYIYIYRSGHNLCIYIRLWIDKCCNWNLFTLKMLLVFSLITIYIYLLDYNHIFFIYFLLTLLIFVFILSLYTAFAFWLWNSHYPVPSMEKCVRDQFKPSDLTHLEQQFALFAPYAAIKKNEVEWTQKVIRKNLLEIIVNLKNRKLKETSFVRQSKD